jgi:hypothetical protein
MKLALAVFFILLGSFAYGTQVDAYNPSVNTSTVPYAVVVIDNAITTQAEYLGELVGDPHMYEFTIGGEETLTLTVSQLENEPPLLLSLIAVKENNHNAGVAEVGRLTAKDIKWKVVDDSVLGLTFLRSQKFEADIGTGVYRVEVSTPDNIGSYMLTVGEEPVSPGYFSTLADIRQIQRFFGKSPLALLKSSYVYYPVGSLVLIGLLYYTWRNRQRIQKRYA